MRSNYMRYSQSTKQGSSLLPWIGQSSVVSSQTLPLHVEGCLVQCWWLWGLLSDLRTCREEGRSNAPLELLSTNDFWGHMTDTAQLPGALTGITLRHIPRDPQRKWILVALFLACPMHLGPSFRYLSQGLHICGNPKTHDDLKHLNWGEATAKPPPIQW